MSFHLRWKHKDGSLIEFSEKGWRADDPEKGAWLNKMSAGSGPPPALTLAIKIWLRWNCEPVESNGRDETHNLNHFNGKPSSDLDRAETDTEHTNHNVAPPSEEKSEPVPRVRRKAMIDHRSIELACDEFFRSRGMPQKLGFNEWNRYDWIDEPGNEPQH